MVPRWGSAHARFGGGSASNGLRDHRGPIRWMVGRRAGWLADWEVSDLTLNGSLNLNGSRILENGLELPANASAGTNVSATRPGVGPHAGCELDLTRAPFRGASSVHRAPVVRAPLSRVVVECDRFRCRMGGGLRG